MDYYDQIHDFLIEELKKIYSAPTVSLWFEPLHISQISKNNVLACLPQNRKTFVEAQYHDILQSKLSEIMGVDVNLEIRSAEEETEELLAFVEEVGERVRGKEPEYVLRYNPDYTFENFVVGKSNQVAYDVSLSVSNMPSQLYNPLYLYGNSGLGKTHLMFAIMNRIRKNNPNFKILYVTGEEFTNELVEALSQKKPIAFREKYRGLDVLLVDDIQFIAGKLTTQEEFFHTFDTLHKLNKQLIIASDCSPAMINNLDERLRSRFSWGLTADIQPPDKELRMAIFKRKAQDYGIELTMDVLFYLADNITTNIRQIEGSLKKLKAHTLVTGEKITLSVAQRVLSDFFVKSKNDDSIIDRIFESAEKRYGVKRDEIKGPKRNAEIAMARHYSIYLIRKTTNLSYKSIAKIFNKKDHSTVMNSIDFIERKMKKEPAFEREMNRMVEELRN